jgi:putative ABC transport system permease protein
VVLLEPEATRYLFIRYTGSRPDSAVRSLVEDIWNVQMPHIPFETSRLDHIFEQAYGDMRNVSLIFGAIGYFTILFSCLGMLGLVSFILNAKTKEIGIRKVLGASAPRILKTLMMEFVSLVAIADVVGIAAACLVWPKLWALYAYQSMVPLWAYLLISLMSLAIAGAAILSKTLSAARRNPVEALKFE